MQFTFTVAGRPQPKQRPRFAGRRAYTPAATIVYEALVRACAVQAVPAGWPLDARYRTAIHMVRGDMKRWDGDNLEKAIHDALNGVAWRDDSQVDACGWFRTLDRDNPHVIVSVFTLDSPWEQ